jgi:cell division protein ZapE
MGRVSLRRHLSRDITTAIDRSAAEAGCTFAQACEAETSSIEFLDWTQRFDRFIFTGIPSFRNVDPAGQQRFINLVDILCDSDTPSYLTSELDYREFSVDAEEPPDAFRTLSRLQLLQGADA